jgi:hypothetical protein
MAEQSPAAQPGPMLLSEQPPVSGRAEPRSNDWGDIFAHLEARLGSLRTWRYTWWQYWARLAQFILPHRYHWVVTSNTMNRGLPVNEAIVDSTATLAMRICAAGMSSGLMSPARPWFRLGAALEAKLDAPAQEWLDDTTQRIYAVLGGSNFYTEASQMFQDVSTFGTSPMIIYEDHEDIVRAYVPCAGEYFLATGARLSVDTLYREFTYTVAQIVDWFTLDACPQQVRTLWEQGGANLEREFVVAHAIEPNFAIAKRGANGGKVNVVPGRFPFREVYWLKGQRTEAELSRRGFHERPFMACRWSKTSNDAYGRGPGMDALGDTQQLQQETRRKGEAIDKTVRPPMGADPELENKPSSILPGEITYVNTGSGGKKGFWPLLDVNPQAIAAITADIETVQKRIDRAFFTNVFLYISQMDGVQPRNELEISERKGEQIQQLGPVIELFETEFASPAIQRVVSIMSRRGLLQPPPPSLAGIPVAIEYVSMMKLAQRAAETGGMERTLATLAKLGEGAMAMGLPNPLRIVNLDETARIYADRLGFPAKALYSQDQVAQNDQAKAKASAQQQMMNAAPQAVDAAEGLSRIPVGGGQSAIGALLGTGAPPQGQAA